MSYFIECNNCISWKICRNVRLGEGKCDNKQSPNVGKWMFSTELCDKFELRAEESPSYID